MVINEALICASEKLSAVTDVPALESKLLMETACNCDRLFLIKNRNDELAPEKLAAFYELVEERLTGRPIAYIIGHREFMGLDFTVNGSVLIPRPDTEILVECAIDSGKKNILDIGTGSGAIAVSLAHYIKGSNLTAIDVSEDALAVAEKNAAANNTCVNFKKADILTDPIDGVYDLIVSNPPYIKNAVIPTLSPDVKNFEPHLALSGGEDGLIFYRAIAKKAPDALVAGGMLMFEIGFDQAEAVCEIMAESFSNISVKKDLAGCDRVCIGTKK